MHCCSFLIHVFYSPLFHFISGYQMFIHQESNIIYEALVTGGICNRLQHTVVLVLDGFSQHLFIDYYSLVL